MYVKIRGIGKLANYMIISIVLLLIIFSVVVETTGYRLFTKNYSSEYSDSAYKVGLTAKALINTNRIDDYLNEKGKSEDYKLSNKDIHYFFFWE